MQNLLSNIAGEFEVKMADALIVKLVLGIALLIVLFFLLKNIS